MSMAGEGSIDVDALRERFPWVGLASIDEPDLSSRYREIISDVKFLGMASQVTRVKPLRWVLQES